MYNYTISVILMVWVIVSNPAVAQVIPPNLQPGAVNNAIILRQPTTDKPVPAQVNSVLPETVMPEQARSGPSVWIQTVRLDGATHLNASDRVLLKQNPGAMDFSAMRQLADQLTQRYIDKGYVNSRVIIPPQNFNQGVLILQAQEATVGDLVWQKSRWFGPLATRINITPGKPFHLPSLSHGLRVTNQNPDQHWTATLIPGKQAGTVDVDLKAQTRFPIHITPFVDNLGRERIGRSRYGISLIHNNLTGLGDSLNSSVSLTQGSVGLVNQYRLPVGRHATQLGVDYAYSHLRLGGPLKPLNITASAQVWSPLVEQTLRLNDHSDVSAHLAIDFKNLKTDLSNQPFYRDRLVVLRPGIQGTFWHNHGKTWLSQDIGIGLPGLGATRRDNALSSKPQASDPFVRLTGQLGRWQMLPHGMTIQCRAGYQFSPYRLQAAEQTQIGGAYTVRGFAEGAALGDSGWFANTELAVPCYFLPKQWVWRGKSIVSPRNALQWVVFLDAGQVWATRPMPGDKKQTTLVGVGVGVRVMINRFLTGRLDVGFPLTGDGEHRARLHIGLQSGLF